MATSRAHRGTCGRVGAPVRAKGDPGPNGAGGQRARGCCHDVLASPRPGCRFAAARERAGCAGAGHGRTGAWGEPACPGDGGADVQLDPAAPGGSRAARLPAHVLRQGARPLRAAGPGSRRRPHPAAAGRHRPHQRVRPRAAHVDPRQGTGAHPDVALVVRPACRPGAEPRGVDRRARPTSLGARCSCSGCTCSRSSAWRAGTLPARVWPSTARPVRCAASRCRRG